MNNTQKILLLGPESTERVELENRLNSLGGDVLSVIPVANFVPEFGEVLFIDARDESTDWTLITGELADDHRPLVMVADAPCGVMRALHGRSGGMLVVTGAENDGGYRVAMNLAAAMAGHERPDRPAEGRRQRSGLRDWAPAAANPAVAI